MTLSNRAGAAARPVETEAGACGRLGLGAAEIAAGVGWSRGELDAAGARWAELAAGRARADDAAAGWWEGRLRRWAGTSRPAPGAWGRAMAERFGKAGAPEPARPRRQLTARDRAKAVALLLAETGVKISELGTSREPDAGRRADAANGG